MDDSKEFIPIEEAVADPPAADSAEEFLALLADLTQDSALPRRKRRLHYYRPRRRLLILLPVLLFTGMLVTAAVLSASYTLCYSVVERGSHLAYVRGADTYQTAVSRVEEQVSEILQSDYQYRQDAAVVPALAPRESIQSPDQLAGSLLETVDQVEACYVLTVDGVTLGSCRSREEISDALNQVKALYATQDTAALYFGSVLDVNQTYLPREETPLDTDQLVQLLTAPADKDILYEVQPEDTVESLCTAFSMTLEAFAQKNSDLGEVLAPGNVVTVTVQMPLLTVYTQDEVTYTQEIPPETEQQEDDTLYVGQTQVLQEGVPGEEEVTARISTCCGEEQSREILNSTILKEAVPQIMAVGTRQPQTATGVFQWPCTGHISSSFGYRYLFGATSFHTGLDIADWEGTPLYAADSGTVCFTGPKGTYGNLIKIDHANGYLTYYGHCASISVSVGQWVEQGEQIGLMGQTGRATGPHCHFEIRWQNEPMDPLGFLP